MIKNKTDFKCAGCNKEFEHVEYDEFLGIGWFARFSGHGHIIEWICRECWKKGVRYEKM